jgi:hypothetical protein
LAGLVDLLADDLRGTWQGRVLAATRNEPLGAVVLSVLAHSYDKELLFLLRVVFPDFTSIRAPFICSTAKVDKTGAVVADMVYPDEPFPRRDVIIFRSEIRMRDIFRDLADELALSDKDREELFICVRNWCPVDRRLDPTMDPQDPDAKRLTTH